MCEPVTATAAIAGAAGVGQAIVGREAADAQRDAIVDADNRRYEQVEAASQQYQQDSPFAPQSGLVQNAGSIYGALLGLSPFPTQLPANSQPAGPVSSQFQQFTGGPEGRFTGDPAADAYLQRYPELLQAFHQDNEGFRTPQEFANAHYSNFGRAEGREWPGAPVSSQFTQPANVSTGPVSQYFAQPDGSYRAGTSYGAQPLTVSNDTTYNPNAGTPVSSMAYQFDESSDLSPMQQFYRSIDPSYDFRFSEGIKAMDQSASARNGLYSSAHGRRLQRYGQDFADQGFQQYLSNLDTVMARSEASAQNVANIATGNAAQSANARIAAANAAAGGAEATADGIGGVGSALSYGVNNGWFED